MLNDSTCSLHIEFYCFSPLSREAASTMIELNFLSLLSLIPCMTLSPCLKYVIIPVTPTTVLVCKTVPSINLRSFRLCTIEYYAVFCSGKEDTYALHR